MIKVAVLFGGRSGEHDVSLCSAAGVISALDKTKYEVIAVGIDRQGRWKVQESPEIIAHPEFGRVMKLNDTGVWNMNYYEDGGKLILVNHDARKRITADVVLPVVHGTYCEDGTLQGLLELAMVPFVGADTAGSAVGMDKDIAKRLLNESGIPVTESITVNKSQWASSRADICGRAAVLGFPLFVKPCRAGSSVGVVKVKKHDEISAAVDTALMYDTKILIEKGIDAREVECAVLGNYSPEASVLGEITPRHDFYSYEAKYLDPEGAELLIPARIDNSLSDKIRECAIKGYTALCCTGMARV
jgi:D-alanine-D-alanine ligase